MTEPTIKNQTSQNGQAQELSAFKKWLSLAVLTLGLVIVVIDTTLLNVSLATIIKDLHTDIQSLQWVITAYALVLAAFTITGGRFGDLFGRKKMFMLGAVIFAVGSFIASISHSVPVLLLGESIIEGFGAALMMPATSSLVVANFKGADRAKAFGIWGGAAGASSAIGPLLGGYLTTHFSWRWGFRINVFVAALVIIGSLLLIKESKDERKPTLDWGGVLLSALGLLGVTFGIIESSTYGWWKAKEVFTLFGHNIQIGSLSIVPFSIAIGAVLLALFFWWEKRVEDKGKTPLVSLSLFKNQQFTSSVLTTSILTLAMSGLIFALPIFLQSVKNLSAFDTGLAMLPLSLGLIVAAPVSGILSKKITPKYIIQCGLIVAVVGALVLHYTLKVDVSIAQLIPGLSLFGIGLGMVFAPISNITLSAVPVQQSGEASGVNNTLRQVGSTLGAAIIGAAVLTSLSANLTKGINQSSVIPERLKAGIVRTVANPNSNIEFGGASNLTSQLPAQIGQEIKSIANESTARASQDAYIYAAIFLLLGLSTALFLPITNVNEDRDTAILSSVASPDPNKKIKIASSIIIAVLAVVGGMWFLHNSSVAALTLPEDLSTPVSETQNDIRSLFPAPENGFHPRSQNFSLGNNSAAVTTPPPVLPTPLAVKPTPAPTPENKIYSNAALAFQIGIPSNWQVMEWPNQSQVVFTGPGGISYSVQSYVNSGEDLNTIRQQLYGSPTVTGVSQTNFAGEAALIFNIQGNYRTGIALVHNGRVYYIMMNGSQSRLSSFRFL